MTQHEKKFLVTGLTLGLMLAFAAYAAMRLWHPDRSAAQSQETPMLKYEAAPKRVSAHRTSASGRLCLQHTAKPERADRHWCRNGRSQTT